MSTAAKSHATQSISYADLYARWERGHWLANEIDFTQDRIDWRERLTDEQRHAALWFMSLFFHGEDEVADDLSPYVTAAPTEEQTYFLTTQQVDEARHSVFFTRFMHEVVGLGDGTVGSGLEATKLHLTWGHKKTFENLAKVADELRHDRSKQKYAEAITNYMIIVEGTMAQPGQHLIESWLERTGLLPGFFEGLKHVANDEQRHIAFGMKTVADLYQEDPDEIGPIIVDAIRKSGTFLVSFAYPDDGDSTYLDSLGISLTDLYADSMRALMSRLRGIGLSDELRAKALTLDTSISFEEQGVRVMRLLDAGYLGPGFRPTSKDPEDLELLWEMLSYIINANAKVGTVVQFEFSDVGAHHYSQTPDGLVYSAGAHPSPSVSIKSSLDDFVAIVNERSNPVKLMLQRKFWVSGDRGLVVGQRSVFGPATEAAPRRIPVLSRFGL
ncbi:MAG: ribonucleotide-diphosphate reductase subunit beta [Solirubrobacteraceae bacterium]|nr:ribonucleotide-diphosphate reductase subunit beta [Solirubrobacteraceae bacterium]